MIDFELINISIPSDIPFINDRLNREPVARMMMHIFSQFDNGAVVAIDSPWGTGKTTFIKMLSALMRKNHYVTLHFNAWESDYTDDPLCALLAKLGEGRNLSDKIKCNLGRIILAGTTEIAKGFFKKISGADCDEISAVIDEVAKIGSDSIKAYEEKRKGLEEFKNALSEFVEHSFQVDEGCKLPIIFFIDELDRCNPHYAIKVLERLKHCFSVTNIVFVISIDKEQLKNSITGYFHSPDMDAEEYLRRFIDVEYTLPKPVYKNYCDYLSNKFNLDKYLIYDGLKSDSINEIVANMAIKSELSLRQLEKFYVHLSIICSSFSIKDLAHYVVFFLLILKFKPALFSEIKDKTYNISSLYKELISIFPNTTDDYNYFIGQILGLYGRFANLINTREKPETWITQDSSMTDDAYQMLYSGMKLTAIDSIGFYPRLEAVLDKIYLYDNITRN